MRNPHEIIVRPHITEKSVGLSLGDPHIRDEAEMVRRYTFIVDTTANKIEIKQAIEAIYNAGRKKNDKVIEVTGVRTIKVPGKKKRRGMRSSGYTPSQKKAIVTLAKGQMLEDYTI